MPPLSDGSRRPMRTRACAPAPRRGRRAGGPEGEVVATRSRSIRGGSMAFGPPRAPARRAGDADV